MILSRCIPLGDFGRREFALERGFLRRRWLAHKASQGAVSRAVLTVPFYRRSIETELERCAIEWHFLGLAEDDSWWADSGEADRSWAQAD